MILIASLMLGLMVGSFLNVLILRLPTGMDFVFKRSHCTTCRREIAFYDNVPLLAFLWLKGRCRYCNAKISIQYPIIELITGLMALYIFTLSGVSLLIGLFHFTIFSVFLVIFLIDLRHQIIPDGLNIYLAVTFLLMAFMEFHWTHILLGGAIGVAFPLTVTWIFYKLRGQIGLGGGDIKLYGALGLYLGPLGIFQNIFLSCFIGSIVGGIFLLVKRLGRSEPIPFGPFIVIVAFVQILFPKVIAKLILFPTF